KERENEGLTVKPGDEDLPDFAQQQRGKWGQTSDYSAQGTVFNGYTAGYTNYANDTSNDISILSPTVPAASIQPSNEND
ncbi:hypothetical protein LTR78_007649, partial [Recurvomyces mirabilis]